MLLPLAYCGVSLGTVTVQSTAGFLAASKGGWPSVFYVTGSCSIIWGILCFLFIRDFPSEHKSVTREERSFIIRNQEKNVDKSREFPIPWRSILASGPVWAIVCAASGYFWAIWTMDTFLPTYMKIMFNVDIKKNGLLSALPHLGMLVSCLLSPVTGHYFPRFFNVSLTFQRKLWNSVGLLGGTLCFLILATTNTSSTAAVLVLTVANFLLATIHIGFKCNLIDLSPNFSALITGLVNGVGPIVPMLAPTLSGFILQSDDPVNACRKIFTVAAAVSAFGGISYAIFASAKTQKWNDADITERMGSQQETPC